MTQVTLVLVVIVVIGALGIVYAMTAPRRAASRRERDSARAPLHASTDWTNAAGQEFAGLSESARCDMIFAVGALDDERSQDLLEHALDDPSEAVALAAAHALAGRGSSAIVERYLASHPGDRAGRIAGTLALLRPET